MANINGLPVNSAVTHAEFMSRTEDTSTTGLVNFQNTTDSSDPTTGAIKTAGGLGVEKSLNVGLSVSVGGELIVSGETTLNDTLNASAILSDGNINTSGSITALDVNAMGAVTALTEVITPLISATTADIDTLNLTNALTVSGLTVTADAVINGNLTVNGTSTTLNTATIDSEDPNITLNKNGNDLSSEGSGLTIDRTGTKGSLQYANALASKFKIGDLASEAEVVTVSHTQTLTNKTLTSPVLTTPSTDIISATEQGSTPSTPASGVRKLYPKADGFYQLDSTGLETKVGSGSGGGGAQNLITDGDAESGIASYIEGSYSAATRPAGTFTASSGAGAFAISTSTTNPINSTTSFLLTKSAGASRQGRAAERTIVLDQEYQTKMLKMKIKHRVISGSFVAGSSTTDSSAIFYIGEFNGTTWKYTEPSSFKALSNSTTIVDYVSGTFQVSYDTTQIKLICYVAETANSAWVLQCEFEISPSVYVYGTPITDFKTVSNPTIVGSTSGTYSPGTGATYRTEVARNGQEWLVNYYIDIGTSAVDVVGAYVFNLPAECRFHSDVQSYETVGYGEITNVATANPVARMVAKVFGTFASNQVILDRSDAELLNVASGFMINSSYIVNVKLRFKGMGTSSSVQMSDSYDGRVISFLGAGTGSTQALTANVTNISFTSVADKTNSWTGSTYIVPSAGDYGLSAFVYAAATSFSVMPYLNGASFNKWLLYSPAGFGGSGKLTMPNLKAGDVISIRSNISATLAADTAQNISIEKIQGSQAIAANETIQALYNVTGSPVMAHNVSTTLLYNSKIYDNFGIYNPATGVVTAPISGYYEITAKVRSSIGTGVSFSHQVTVNSTGIGGGIAVENAGVSPAGFSTFPTTVNPCSVYLLAGQTATPSFYHFNSASASVTLAISQLSIKKVG